MMVIQNVNCLKKKTSCLIYLSRICALLFSLFLILPFSKNAAAGENIVTEIVGIGGLCIDLPYNNTANGTDLWMWGCNETNAQSWTLHTNGEITVRGKCLDVEGPSSNNGTDAQVWDCVNVSQQKFWVTVAGQIKSRYSGKCLTVKNAATSFETRLEFEPCDQRSEQRFAFPGAPSERKWCGGWWTNALTWDFSSRKGMVMRLEPTKKARIQGISGWDNAKNCIPSKYENSLWTFDNEEAGVASMKHQALCHGAGANLYPWAGGPTWDLESYSNLSSSPIDWVKTKCNGTVLRN
jgi:hypothetical protein